MSTDTEPNDVHGSLSKQGSVHIGIQSLFLRMNPSPKKDVLSMIQIYSSSGLLERSSFSCAVP